MANVKSPSVNTISAIPPGGNSAVITSCVPKSKQDNGHLLSKRQQKALNNFLFGRQSRTCLVKQIAPEQSDAISISVSPHSTTAILSPIASKR